MGMIFFVYPEWYVDLEGATTDNIAWLRNLGARPSRGQRRRSSSGRDPEGEKALYDVVMLASVLETIALAWSTFAWEFTATEEIFITGPLALAFLVSIALVALRPKPSA